MQRSLFLEIIFGSLFSTCLHEAGVFDEQNVRLDACLLSTDLKAEEMLSLQTG